MRPVSTTDAFNSSSELFFWSSALLSVLLYLLVKSNSGGNCLLLTEGLVRASLDILGLDLESGDEVLRADAGELSALGSWNISEGLEKIWTTWLMILLLNLMIRKWTVYWRTTAPNPLNRPDTPSWPIRNKYYWKCVDQSEIRSVLTNQKRE